MKVKAKHDTAYGIDYLPPVEKRNGFWWWVKVTFIGVLLLVGLLTKLGLVGP